MKIMKIHSSANRQQGTALVVSLLLLIVMTLIVLSGSRNSSLQLRMASNLESRVEAQQWAQAGLDYAVTLTSTDTAGATSICSTFNPEQTCIKTVPMPAVFNNTSPNGTSWIHLEEGDAGLGGGCGRALAVSVDQFDCTFYEAYSTYDDTKKGRGRATLGTGLVRIVPKS
jgi:hypothetical protein